MKIGIIFKPYATIEKPFRGGMGNFVYLLSKYLAERGHKVEVLAGKNSKLAKNVTLYKLKHSEDFFNVYKAGEEFYKKAEKKKTKRDVVNTSFGELSARFDAKIEAYLEFYSYLNKNKFNVVHVVTHDIIALYSALFSSVPSVASFHGHYDILGDDFVGWLKYLKNYKTKIPCSFVSVSKFLQKEYDKFVKSKLIYNGIDVLQYKVIEKKKNYIAFLGRIEEKKGLNFAIEFSKKYEIPLIIGGRIDNEYYFNKIKKQIDGKLIKFIGPQNEKQKNRLLGEAKCLIMPSHYKEAFGRVTAESLACGTPVIGFKKGATPELVINKKTGFVVNENDFIATKKAWDKISTIKPSDCRKMVEEKFDIEKNISKYLELYEKIKKQ